MRCLSVDRILIERRAAASIERVRLPIGQLGAGSRTGLRLLETKSGSGAGKAHKSQPPAVLA
jgi:hypothetical protein